MNPDARISKPGFGSRLTITLGSIAMLVGAIDPMEGSVIILPGSGLVALGYWLGHQERHLTLYRVWVFVLVAIGVAALFGLSHLGGIGGPSGHSMWWGILILPYLIGWSMGVWGPGTPRWLPGLGSVVGLWYLVLASMVLKHGIARPAGSNLPAIIIGAFGVLTLAGCIWRLKRDLANR